MTSEMSQECVRLFTRQTELQAQQGQLITTQAEMLAELKTLVTNHYVQLTSDINVIKDKIAPIPDIKKDVTQMKEDVKPLAWVKWVTLVIGGVLIAQAIANIFS